MWRFIILLKIALNGARPKSDNDNIPQSLIEIEKEVRLIHQNGYKVFHIHCYDQNGNESLKPDDVNSLVSAVKNISSEIKIGISTGEWIEPDLQKRFKYINEWKVLPDFVSVNMIEDNAIDVSKLIISKGIWIEAGLNEKKAAEIFANSSIIDGCMRVLIEPEGDEFTSTIKIINEIESVLNLHQIKLRRLLHGFNSVSWDVLREAVKRNYDSRIGMEDTIYLENGKKVKSNLEMVNKAEAIIKSINHNYRKLY